jgi:DMSO/TMAO reductase YedYZ molybdopterin-dependent catalytic subunit
VLAGAGTAAVAVTLATAGQTVPALDAASVLAPRRPRTAPGGVPVNRTAADAGVHAAATDPGWRLVVAGPNPVALGAAELARLPQYDVRLPIACVEGWSATALWSGVRLRDVLALAQVPDDAHLRLVSLERTGLYGTSPMAPPTANDPLTLLATRLDGAPLSLDHGFPLRLIAPNRPGVQQTKWLARIETVTA